ncbi:MAG: YbhB/YbcL family Raf kinase inhibitor-like protein, partial [Fimbriimonadales bacterium]
NIQLNNESGAIDYNIETGQGQIVLNTAQGRVQIVFRGDTVEAIYPDGRREGVNLNQWADPCGGNGNQNGGDNNQDGDGNQDETPTNLTLRSDSFQNNGVIPIAHASTEVGGQNRSPALRWSGAPSGTQSFVVVCIDIDADNFVHWVVYDIPASASSLPEGVPNQPTLNNGAKQGVNDIDGIGYFGPEPPEGEHRYVFTIYALSVSSLGLEPGASLSEVEQAMQGKVLGRAQIVGRFAAR